ncbi:MAG: beta-ketoacyl-ACP synthase III [Akkermansia sp.]
MAANSEIAFKRLPVKIIGTGSYVPERRLTNADLEKMVDTSHEWIIERTGIVERRIAAPDEYTSHMGTKAAQRALESCGLQPEDIDLIIVSTITPDTFTPATSCYIQDALGAKNAAAFDISAACSGFLFAMKTAVQYIGTGQMKTALIIAAEKLSTVVNWEDRSTCVLFGDGAGQPCSRPPRGRGRRFRPCHGYRFGRLLHDLLQIPGGGSRCPTTAENAHERLATLAMRGNETFRHAVTRMKASAASVIERAGLTADDIQLIIPHQANLRIINAVAQRLSIPEDKVFVNIEKYGNTSAAAVAIAFDEARRSGRFGKGDNVVLVTFGAGLTWSAAVIRW